MNDIIPQLQQLGFGEYEARAYVMLLQRSPLNGYELAKASGLPRANIYAVLQKLEERGAVVRLDVPDGIRYGPVAPHELLQRLGSRFQSTLDDAERALERLTYPPDPQYVWNARGYTVMLEHARTVVDAVSRNLTLAVWPSEARALAGNVACAEERGVKITTLCLAACPHECAQCRGTIHRYRVAESSPMRWLVAVSDAAELLAGEIGPDDAALAVRTRQRLLVELALGYVRHSIALAAVLGDLGDRAESRLMPETRAILSSVGPGGPDVGWLEHMRQLLAGQGE